MARLTRRDCLMLGLLPAGLQAPAARSDAADDPDGRFTAPFDRVVAATANWRGRADAPELWEPFCRRIGAIAEATRAPLSTPRWSAADFWSAANFLRAAEFPPEVRGEPYTVPLLAPESVFARPTAVIAPRVTTEGHLDCSLIVSREDVLAVQPSRSVIIANGDVVIDGSINSVVIVADGHVTLTGYASRSVVVARGDITLHTLQRCALAAGGRVVFKNPGVRRSGFTKEERVLEGDPNPFGVVRFTSSADLGVDAASAWGEPVRVAASLPGGLLRPGTFHTGDEIVRVGETPVADAETFRRLVRDAAAVGREVIVTGRRSGRLFGVRAGR